MVAKSLHTQRDFSVKWRGVEELKDAGKEETKQCHSGTKERRKEGTKSGITEPKGGRKYRLKKVKTVVRFAQVLSWLFPCSNDRSPCVVQIPFLPKIGLETP